MRPLTLPHTNSRHLRTNYNTLLIFIIGEYFVLVFVFFCFALEVEMAVVVVATVEHHRIVGLPRQSWSVVGNIREAFLIKKALTLFVFLFNSLFNCLSAKPKLVGGRKY